MRSTKRFSICRPHLLWRGPGQQLQYPIAENKTGRDRPKRGCQGDARDPKPAHKNEV